MAVLYVLCGVPGSGKSTFARDFKRNGNIVHISRDEIRFSILEDGDSYFAHEDEVTEIFWDTINKNLAAGVSVIADQTSLNFRSRCWLLDHIHVPCTKMAIYMDIPFSVCKERNAQRTGLQRVPDSKLRGMFNAFTLPVIEEGFDYIGRVGQDNILWIEDSKVGDE